MMPFISFLFKSVISDPPEIEIEQNWFRRDGHIEVEIICVVHAEPEAQVIKYSQSVPDVRAIIMTRII